MHFLQVVFLMRILNFLWIRFCCVAIFCAISYAQEFGFGVNVSGGYYKYSEPQVMNISGAMYGVGGYAYMAQQRFRHQIHANYFGGITRYDGSECGITNATLCTPLQSTSQDSYYTLEYRFGSFMYQDSETFVYTGFGLGFWDLDNAISASSGYAREQSYVYMPLFIHMQYGFSHRIALYGIFTYQQLLCGYNTSHFQDIGFDRNLYFTQNRGYGVRLDIGVRRNLDEYGYSGVIVFGAYLQYWNIADSSADSAYYNGRFIGVYYEPHNITQAVGMSIGYEF